MPNEIPYTINDLNSSIHRYIYIYVTSYVVPRLAAFFTFIYRRMLINAHHRCTYREVYGRMIKRINADKDEEGGGLFYIIWLFTDRVTILIDGRSLLHLARPLGMIPIAPPGSQTLYWTNSTRDVYPTLVSEFARPSLSLSSPSQPS